MNIGDLQRRLGDYMHEYDYTNEDVAKLLNVSLLRVESFQSVTSGTHVLFNKIMEFVSHPGSDLTYKEKATSALKAFKAQNKLKWKDVELLLSQADIRAFTRGSLSVAISPTGTCSDQYFMDIMESIKWCETADVSDTAHDDVEACEPPRIDQEAVDVATQEHGNETSEMITDAAKMIIKHMLDVDIDELKAMKPAIEHMALCIRNGTPCRLVVDDVNVGGMPA